MLAAASSHSFEAGDWLLLVIIVILVVASGFLALAETSLVRMSRHKAAGIAAERRRGGTALVWLVEHPERLLNPVLLMVLLCQLVAATLVGFLAAHLFGDLGVAVATVFEVAVIFVLGEAVPKNWALRHPQQAALFSAPL